MKRLVAIVLCLTLLSGCSWQSLNPFNWFDGNSDTVVLSAPQAVDDGTRLIAQVLNARAERTPDGVILHATGLSAAQGAYGAQLKAAFGADGAFSHMEFRVVQPENDAIGPDASRAIVAAGFLTNSEAAALGSVTIRAAQNAITVNLR